MNNRLRALVSLEPKFTAGETFDRIMNADGEPIYFRPGREFRVVRFSEAHYSESDPEPLAWLEFEPAPRVVAGA